MRKFLIFALIVHGLYCTICRAANLPPSPIRQVWGGGRHTMALLNDGSVWTWGWNAMGQLGDGTTNDAHTPVQVVGLSNIVAISGRGYHTLALDASGSVWAWGWNATGQLGDGTTSNSSVPLRVAGVTNPAMISAAYKISMVLMSNGTVKVWGTDSKGEMGQGVFFTNHYSPITVPGISNVVSISADFQEPEALMSDGRIWMWGWNNLGQLGNGNTNDTCVPAPVPGLTNMIFAGQTGDRDNCAIDTNHTVYMWGRNFNGQLGIGTADQNPHPTPIALPHWGNGYVTMVQTPDWHSLALESDGTLWAWGSNDHGQDGNGTTNDQYSPTLVTWPSVPPASPIQLNISNTSKQIDGSFQFNFTNAPGTQFTVVSANSLAVPAANWTPIGSVTETSPGHFQFKDPAASLKPSQFYRVISP